MPTQIKFGTDGWRGLIADDFTFDNVRHVAGAIASYVLKHEDAARGIVIGYDTRFLSDRAARAVAEVIAAAGIPVRLANDYVPTPTVSYNVKKLGAAGGVMVTSSHNPWNWNGVKFKAKFGGSATPAIMKSIEEQLAAGTMPKGQAAKIEEVDLKPAYVEAISEFADLDLIRRANFKFAIDSMYGSGRGVLPGIFDAHGIRYVAIRQEVNPLFPGINPEPIIPHVALLQEAVVKERCHAGLVTDGDADRVGGMDGHGGYLTTHQIICLLLHHLIVNRKGRGSASAKTASARPLRVVKALTTTSMVDKMCAAYGLPLVETGVGFKYICAEMLKGDVLLGAEESGGIGFPGHIPERDGIAAGLMLLELLATERVSVNRLLAKLEKQFGPHRYGRIDTHYPLQKRASLMEFLKNNPPDKLLGSPLADIKTFDGVKFVAEDSSWLMLRGSGTEPVLRIYAETKSAAGVQKLLKLGVSLTRR